MWLSAVMCAIGLFVYQLTRKKEKIMKRRLVIILVVLMLAAIAVIPASANRGHGALGVVYVSGQGLYYDTFVTVEVLPFHGRFQQLEDGVTPYGPGDQGYVGGRWWVDNPEEGIIGEMDAADTYLLCPLLGPGRETP
jgi:hypothetical protein